MILINHNTGENFFTLNGTNVRSRVYQAVKMGSYNIAIYGINDTKDQLLPTTPYSEVKVNGVFYHSQDALLKVLNANLLYHGATGTSDGSTGEGKDWQSKLDLKEDKFSKNTAFNKNFGSGADQVAEGNDPRFSHGTTAFGWGDHNAVGYLIDETVTQLNTPTLAGNVLTLKFVNENGVEQSVAIDLSSLNLTETGITNATYDAAQNIITLTEQDGDVYTINLSEFSIVSTTDAQGITTLTQEGAVKLTVSKVGRTGQWSDILGKPSTYPATAHTHSKGEITDFAHTHFWSEITNKPTEFNPTVHSHLWSHITDKPTEFNPAAHNHEIFTKTVNGFVPAPTGTTSARYLREDGMWVIPTNTTYSIGSDAEFDNTLSTTGRLISGQRINSFLDRAGRANWNTAFGWGNHAGLYSLVNHTHSWTEINGKPTTFTPSAHTHLWSHITDKPSTFTPSTHTHTVAQISDFPVIPNSTSDLTNDSGFITGVAWAEVTSKPLSFPPSAHTHDDRYYTEVEIDTKLGSKANTAHTHTVSQITDFPVVPNSTSDLINDSGFITATDVPDGKTKVRVININSADLTTVDEAGVVQYLNTNGFTKFKIETLIINVGAVTTTPTQPTTITVVITQPTEGAEVTGNFSTLFSLDNTTGINISNLTEGQEITADYSLNIQLI